MPHAFKAYPNHPAVAYLVRLHADLGGRILGNRKEAKRLAESMKHVEAVIRLFDPAYDTLPHSRPQVLQGQRLVQAGHAATACLGRAQEGSGSRSQRGR